jgi:hypothetical protein
MDMALVDRLLATAARVAQDYAVTGRRRAGGRAWAAPHPASRYPATPYPGPYPAAAFRASGRGADRSIPHDRAAVERYRYLLRTAPPEQIEQAHAEAFARLTPQQRQQVLAGLSDHVPAAERPATADPRALARMATRAELRRPGTLLRAFGGPGVAAGALAGGLAGGLLAGVAAAFVGSAIIDGLVDTGIGDLDLPDVAGDGFGGVLGGIVSFDGIDL